MTDKTDMSLRDAAQAVIDRWETPLWKDAPATAVFIADLRDALARDAGRASLQSPGFSAEDMATASAQGFRDGVASLSANAGEPVAHLWQHCETGRTRIVMPDMIVDADASWQVVGPLYLDAAPPTAQAERLPSRHELALQMLVAGGFVTETKLQQALALVDAACPALAPPTSAEGVEP